MPRMKRAPAVFGTASLLLLLLGCGSSSSDTVQTTAPQSGSSRSPSESGKQGEIVESGFGQSTGTNAQYVWVTALVKNLSDHGGQTVTVNFNLMDKSGKVVDTESQVEGFNIAGQQLALGTQADVGRGVTIASVQPTLLVEDQGTFPEIDTDLGSYPASSITPDQYDKSQWHATFVIKNPTDQLLKSPRIGIICHGADGKVNGGTSEFPNLVPASGQIVVKTLSLITSGKPKDCIAYVGAGI